jgi:hypothetical protein
MLRRGSGVDRGNGRKYAASPWIFNYVEARGLPLEGSGNPGDGLAEERAGRGRSGGARDEERDDRGAWLKANDEPAEGDSEDRDDRDRPGEGRSEERDGDRRPVPPVPTSAI